MSNNSGIDTDDTDSGQYMSSGIPADFEPKGLDLQHGFEACDNGCGFEWSGKHSPGCPEWVPVPLPEERLKSCAHGKPIGSGCPKCRAHMQRLVAPGEDYTGTAPNPLIRDERLVANSGVDPLQTAESDEGLQVTPDPTEPSALAGPRPATPCSISSVDEMLAEGFAPAEPDNSASSVSGSTRYSCISEHDAPNSDAPTDGSTTNEAIPDLPRGIDGNFYQPPVGLAGRVIDAAYWLDVPLGEKVDRLVTEWLDEREDCVPETKRIDADSVSNPDECFTDEVLRERNLSSSLPEKLEGLSRRDLLAGFQMLMHQWWGRRCRSHDAECHTCQSWDEYDAAIVPRASAEDGLVPSKEWTDGYHAGLDESTADMSRPTCPFDRCRYPHAKWVLCEESDPDHGLKADLAKGVCDFACAVGEVDPECEHHSRIQHGDYIERIADLELQVLELQARIDSLHACARSREVGPSGPEVS